MNSTLFWPAIAGALVFTVVVGFLLTDMLRREDQISQRIRIVQGRHRAGAAAGANRMESMLNAVRRLGVVIIQSGLLSRKAIRDLELTLAAAGYRASTALPLVVGNKVALMIGLPVISWLAAGSVNFDGDALKWIAAGGGATLGLMLPDLVIGRLRKRYLQEAERGLPDALDLLVICADAGLPLETALDRVAQEFRESDPPTANELALTAGEMKILPDRRQALVNLGVRTGLESFIALGGTFFCRCRTRPFHRGRFRQLRHRYRSTQKAIARCQGQSRSIRYLSAVWCLVSPPLWYRERAGARSVSPNGVDEVGG